MDCVVYTITCNSHDVYHLYVGSSQDFTRRMSDHKYRSKNETNTNKLYTAIRSYGGYKNWTIEAIETSTCETNLEIRTRERFWFDELRPSLNSYRTQSSQEEIRLVKMEKMKQYQIDNKEKLS